MTKPDHLKSSQELDNRAFDFDGQEAYKVLQTSAVELSIKETVGDSIDGLKVTDTHGHLLQEILKQLKINNFYQSLMTEIDVDGIDLD